MVVLGPVDLGPVLADRFQSLVADILVEDCSDVDLAVVEAVVGVDIVADIAACIDFADHYSGIDFAEHRYE